MGNQKALTLEEIEELIKLRDSKRQNKANHRENISSDKKAQRAAEKTGNQEIKKERPTKPGIVINRMYVGGYLESNLGHEIINLFKADNGGHYLYLNSSGSFAQEHSDIDYMLMVKYVDSCRFEVIGLAVGLEYAPGADSPRPRDIKTLDEKISGRQREYILSQPEGGIRYGGVSILDIFNDAEQQSVFVTYKAREVFVPKGEMRIFLRYGKEGENYFGEKETVICLKNHNMPKTSLKSYIYPEKDSAKLSDYDNIVENLIGRQSLWSSEREWQVNTDSDISKREISLFDICQIQDDENRFSNAIAYFMSQQSYRSLWVEFFRRYDIELEGEYIVERESSAKIEDSEQSKIIPNGGRIDILISDSSNLIVIENKIKSDINLVERDKAGVTQLDRYVNYIEWRIANNETPKEGHFLILCPDYNIPHLTDRAKRYYKIVTYGDLYEYLLKIPSVGKDNNFRALRDAMQRHTYTTPNGYLYNEILEKFEQRVREKSRTI